MSLLSVRLFSRLSVRCDEQVVRGLNASKVRELFCYLLLHRDRAHPREALASLLWGDTSTSQSKKYLRQSLWQLQGALKCHVESGASQLLLIDSDWVQLNSAAQLRLDVAEFEEAALLGRGAPCENLDAETVGVLQRAVELYQGDLLEGWYQEWCLFERERLQNIYLIILDKLMRYCESHELFDAGLRYGALSLRYDKARECTHQRLMRMHFLAGDRAAALRQYDRCVFALEEDLGVKPSEETIALYQQISGGRVCYPSVASSRIAGTRGPEATALADVLGRLRQVEAFVAGIQHQLHTDIQTIETALSRHWRDGVERRAPVRSVPGAHDPSPAQKPAVARASMPGLKTGAR